MKIRNGFVSNSSSSSFVIKKKNLTSEQIEFIKNHSAKGAELGFAYYDDEWDIREFIEYGGTDECIAGDTCMDNFDMHGFLNAIGIKDADIMGSSDNMNWPNEESDEN